MVGQPEIRTIAMFGATGHTGRALLRHLLSQTESASLRLQIYVRSKAKLLDLFPDIEPHPHITLCQGSITDLEVVRSCVFNAQIIICTLGENDNIPGVRILQDAANSILTSLEELKATKKDYQKPRLFLLSSATYNPRFAAARLPVVHWLIKTAFSHPYADLVIAQRRYLESTSLLSVVLIQPPLLVDDEGSGYEISTEAVQLAVSYPDLGAAFAELVLNPGYDTLDAVGVSSKEGDRFLRYAPTIFRLISRGMFAHLTNYLFPKKT